MMEKWSSNWKASKRPRKQRNYAYKAPLHVKQKFVSAHLSKELRKKHGKRSIGIRKGDKVKIMRGQFKGKTGAVSLVNVKQSKVAVEGIDNIRKDGTKTPYMFVPSNLMITEIMIEDKQRKAMLERKGK
ncbi:MAG: 50S ribosomal protein L24 [Candidatus Nanoarchaeia archaeon]|nr:50S ribosomal protein L24 [Candidatus Nanoarchaeia archaeon]